MASKTTKTSKFYPIEDDWKKLSDKYKNKIPAGVRIYGEKVDKVYTIIDWIPLFSNIEEDLREKGYFFLPQYESRNFMQGLLLRPPTGTVIDQVYNREFYPKHFEKLFCEATGSEVIGFDPVLATVGDLLLGFANTLFDLITVFSHFPTLKESKSKPRILEISLKESKKSIFLCLSATIVRPEILV